MGFMTMTIAFLLYPPCMQHWSWKVKRYVESMTIILSTFLLLLLETVATRGFNWRVCHANCEIFGFSIESCCNNFHPPPSSQHGEIWLYWRRRRECTVAWLLYKKKLTRFPNTLAHFAKMSHSTTKDAFPISPIQKLCISLPQQNGAS